MAFSSLATNLVDNDTNGVMDVFLHDNREYAEITSEDFATTNAEQLNKFLH